MGDYNLDLIKHDLHPPTNEFINLMLSHSMLPSIDKPTRLTEFTHTLIDNIYTNVPHLEFTSNIIISDLSDHFPIFIFNQLTRYFKIDRKENVQITNYKPEFLDKFIQKLNQETWSIKFDSKQDDPNYLYSKFFDTYSRIYSESFPKITRRSSNTIPRHPWLTTGLIRACTKKNKLFKKY